MTIDDQSDKTNWFYGLMMPAIYLTIIWGIFLLEHFQGYDFAEFGLAPREPSGLIGIVTMHFLHGSWDHILGNSSAIAVLLWGLFYFYRRLAFQVMLLTMFMTGLYLWLFGNPGFHIGASGLIYGLAAFLGISGFIRRRTELLAVSLIVVFLYGGMVWWVFPIDPTISWQGHLFGALSGIILSFYYKKRGPQRPKYQWEIDEIEEQRQLEEFQKRLAESEAASPIASPINTTNPGSNVRIVYYYRTPPKPESQSPGGTENPEA